jgi:uncharacterized membrane-anchored protein
MSWPKTNLRVVVAVVVGISILAFLNGDIFQKERLVERGRVVLLRLAPVDPRSLMQGDYMALRFALADDIHKAAGDETGKGGKAILKLDENNIAHFIRIDDGRLPLQQDEIRLQYRIRDKRGNVKIATNAFFFEEGKGKTYEPARYGEFRVADDGEAILTQLRDEQLKVLGRSAVLD